MTQVTSHPHQKFKYTSDKHMVCMMYVCMYILHAVLDFSLQNSISNNKKILSFSTPFLQHTYNVLSDVQHLDDNNPKKSHSSPWIPPRHPRNTREKSVQHRHHVLGCPTRLSPSLRRQPLPRQYCSQHPRLSTTSNYVTQTLTQGRR